MKVIWMVVVVTVAGCARDPQKFLHTFDPCEPLALVIASDATASERASIDDALAMWRAVARIDVSVGTDGAQIPVRFAKAASAFYGFFDDKLGEISVNDDLTDEHTRAIVFAHELGHAMGLYHVYGRPSVMNTPNLKTVPTAGDGEELVATWGACPSIMPERVVAPTPRADPAAR